MPNTDPREKLYPKSLNNQMGNVRMIGKPTGFDLRRTGQRLLCLKGRLRNRYIMRSLMPDIAGIVFILQRYKSISTGTMTF